MNASPDHSWKMEVDGAPKADLVVIIPTIRVDDWLDDAVQSVLDQEGVEPHIVVFHDGVAPDVSRSWMSSPQVTAMHSATRLGLARGLAMAVAATSESYVARLDADDLSSPARLNEQLAYLKSHPSTVLVGTQGVRIDELGEFKSEINITTGADVRLPLLRRNCLIHPSVVFRRDAYVAAGGYDELLPTMEDYDLWLRIATFGEVAVLESRSVSYRLHQRQMSRGAKPYGIHIRKIMSSHRLLAASLGVNSIFAFAHASAWLAAQYLRYYGLRKPGYDR